MDLHTLIYIISGILLAGIGFSAVFLKKSFFTPSMIYLAIGVLLGPHAFAVINFDIHQHWETVEYITELVVLVAVFAAGLKMRPHLPNRVWSAPLKLAFLGVALGVAFITGVGTLFGFTIPMAMMIGAIMAPTDPVLASAVQVEHEDDKDRLRFSFTAEAGLNDGTAYPFTLLALGLLGLHELGTGYSEWFIKDVLFALIGAFVIGYVFARIAAAAINSIRKHDNNKSNPVLDEFFGLGLLGLVYGVCLSAGVYGFVAAFVAGVVFRRYEITNSTEGEKSQEATEEIITFNDNIEKLGEFVCILALGSVLHLSQFTLPTVAFALIILFVVRPVMVFCSFTALTKRQKLLSSWFGVRGVGSLFYLAFVINTAVKHGQPEVFNPLIDLVFVTITISILVHGATANPLMNYYKRAKRSAPVEV